MIPGFACMAGLFGASIPVTVPKYDLDDAWRDFVCNPTPAPAELPAV